MLQLQITRIGVPYQGEPPNLVLPIVYDITSNLTQLAQKPELGPSSVSTAASIQLKRFGDYHSVSPNHTTECTIFPAVRDLLANLTLPSEPSAISQVSYLPWKK